MNDRSAGARTVEIGRRRRTPPKNASWTPDDAEGRLLEAAEEEVRCCPNGQEIAIEKMLRRLADNLEDRRIVYSGVQLVGWERISFLMGQLDDARPGERFPVRNSRGRLLNFMGTASTFPDDMFGLPRTRQGVDRLKKIVWNVINGKICGTFEQRVLLWAISWCNRDEDMTTSGPQAYDEPEHQLIFA